MSTKFLLSVLFFTVLTYNAAGLEVPAYRGRINDYAGVLSAKYRQELEAYLASVESQSGAQVALLVLESLEGENLELFSIRVADTWRPGTEQNDNGVILLVALQEKKLRIEVGYGLEGVLTDAVSGIIIREIIVPEFRQGNFEEGIAAGLQAIGAQATGEVESLPAGNRRNGRQSGSAAGIFMLLFFVLFFLGNLGRSRRFGRRSVMGGFILGSMLGSSMRRSGGFGSRGGGFGGGGFGGFGGGGVGGGGASGGW